MCVVLCKQPIDLYTLCIFMLFYGFFMKVECRVILSEKANSKVRTYMGVHNITRKEIAISKILEEMDFVFNEEQHG